MSAQWNEMPTQWDEMPTQWDEMPTQWDEMPGLYLTHLKSRLSSLDFRFVGASRPISMIG